MSSSLPYAPIAATGDPGLSNCYHRDGVRQSLQQFARRVPPRRIAGAPVPTAPVADRPCRSRDQAKLDKRTYGGVIGAGGCPEKSCQITEAHPALIRGGGQGQEQLSPIAVPKNAG
ncbi:hypothetical protein [Kitasatospora sp. NBC_00039]|uniref:hypothetical protein n=1 Tax=Kitasatospora sp. NBC_00039 TaxID=2903565 RepID=UPI00324C2610